MSNYKQKGFIVIIENISIRGKIMKKVYEGKLLVQTGGFIHSGIILYIQNRLKSFGNKHGIYQILENYLRKKPKVYKQQCLIPCNVKEVIFLAKKYIRECNKEGLND